MLAAVVLVVWLSFAAPVARAAGASIVVNSTADADTADSVCTLREAITAANNNANYNGCTSSGYGDDTITFSVAGPITLGSTLPNIVAGQGTLTIDGGGALTISGANSVREFWVNAGANLTLQNVTITGGKGNYGGGVNNNGTLTVVNSTFSSNQATSLGSAVSGASGSTTNISNSTISSNSDSAVYNQGTLTVTNSNISANSGSPLGGPGGIYNDGGTATVTNSTFLINEGGGGISGGGIANSLGGSVLTVSNSVFAGNTGYYGGGIVNSYGTATVVNSTFSGNSATASGGAIYNNRGPFTVINSTISGNTASGGGGIYNYTTAHTMVLRNTIVSNSGAGDCVLASGTLTADSYNLDTDGSCDNATIKTNSEIKLTALGFNGGPTRTMALQYGSAAIGAGDDSVCSASPVNNLDQRGAARPQGTHCDVGAYEYGATNQTITFGALSDKAYGDAPFGVSATSSSGLTITFTASGQCSVSTTTVTLTGAGTCTVTARQTGDLYYIAATDVPRTFSVAKGNQTISFTALADKTFGDSPFAVSATASSSLAVTFGASGQCSISGMTVTLTGSGSCTVTAQQAGDSNYNPASNLPRTFSIAKANQTIEFAALSDKTAGAAPLTIAATASSGLAVTFSASGSCTVSGTTVTLTGGGSCTITAQQSGNANYNAAADVARTFSIGKVDQTISFAALSDKAVGAAPFTVSATASSGLAVTFSASGSCTVSGSMVTLTGSGICTITAHQAGDSNYNAAPDVARSFQIGAKMYLPLVIR